MTIGQRIALIIAESESANKTLPGLSEYIGIPAVDIARWQDDDSDFPARLLVPTAEYLQVDLRRLLVDTPITEDNCESSLSSDALEFAHRFDSLDKDSQRLVSASLISAEDRAKSKHGLPYLVSEYGTETCKEVYGPRKKALIDILFEYASEHKGGNNAF